MHQIKPKRREWQGVQTAVYNSQPTTEDARGSQSHYDKVVLTNTILQSQSLNQNSLEFTETSGIILPHEYLFIKLVLRSIQITYVLFL